MKNKIVSLLFLAVVVATAGCNKKFLEDMKSYDKFTESIFTNEVQTGYYIDRLYKDFFGSYNSPTKTLVGTYDDTRRALTEEFGGISNYTNPNKTLVLASDADAYYTGGKPGNLPTGIDNNPYTRIRNANILLTKIDSVGTALSEDFKKTAKGQMFFFRALQYFDLVRVYGGVPIELEVHDASFDNESIKTPRAKTSEVFDQIIKDFDSAVYYLPMKWANQGSDYGRFTRAAALAMKSRVLLTAASPLFNPNWDNPGDVRWQNALAASRAAEDSLKKDYGSAIKTAKDWGEYTSVNDNKTNGEGIFVLLMSNTITSNAGMSNGWENSIRPKEQIGGGGISVPKGMLDLFPMADGKRPVIGTNYNDTYFFEGRDPRFYRTFAFSGSKWGVKGNPNKSVWFYRWKTSATAAKTYKDNNTNSPALVRKFSNSAADSTAYNFSGTDIYDFRWAELLLNIAECYAATGDLANCATYLGKIRARVYPSSAAATNYGIGFTFADKYAALEACLYERRVELAYEGKRFWDMQRWMLYDDDAAIGDNTNTLLNIPKLNGTNRNGYYWQAKTGTSDPLNDVDRSLMIDPDGSTFAADIAKLKTIFDTKLMIAPLDQPMDVDGKNPVNVLFRSNYYLSGFKNDLLGNNPWLPQTIGWQDYNGAMGTYDYRQ
jgi:starch-binding outer membrane protein, SusD/RagB family